MKYLLDTSVLSDATAKRPSAAVEAWLDAQDEEGLYVSALSIGEIEMGIARLADAPKARLLSRWLQRGVIDRFEGRILAIDEAVAREWGRLCARRARVGRRMPEADALIAATALTHGLVVATRNVADFSYAEVELFNPWNGT